VKSRLSPGVTETGKHSAVGDSLTCDISPAYSRLRVVQRDDSAMKAFREIFPQLFLPGVAVEGEMRQRLACFGRTSMVFAWNFRFSLLKDAMTGPTDAETGRFDHCFAYTRLDSRAEKET
jgi:hypothetical protein